MKSLSEARRLEAKNNVTLHISQFIEKYSRVLSFFPLENEINLAEINKILVEQNKLILPRVEGDHIVPYWVPSFHNTLVHNAWGVLEPDPTCCETCMAADCVLVPALSFDRKNNRLGRGKGYYDRLLGSGQYGYSIGVAFQEQVTSDILPTETHDQAVKFLCVG